MELTKILALARYTAGEFSQHNGEAIYSFNDEELQAFVAAVEQRAVDSEKLNPWKAAAINGLVCSEIYTKELDESPTAALDALINWNVQVALDPAVSSETAALEQRAYQRGLEDAAKKCETDNGLHGRWLAEDIRAMKEPK